MVEKPDITYDMVAGLDDEILSVEKQLNYRLQASIIQEVGLNLKGVLLVGPYIAERHCLLRRWLITQMRHSFGWFKLAQYIGEGGRLVRIIFACEG